MPAVPYIPFERAILKWLREVQINVDNGGVDVQALQARKEDLDCRIAELMSEMRSGKNLKRAATLLDEWETELEQVSHELEIASIPRTNQLGRTQNLITLLDNADEESRNALRRQIKQQLKLLVARIEIRVEGKPRTKSKRVYCTVYFKDGQERRIWFQTGKDAVPDGLWTNDGGFSVADMDALYAMTLENVDPADWPPEAKEFFERRQRGEGPPPDMRIFVNITPTETEK